MTIIQVRYPIHDFEVCDRCGSKAKVGASFLSGELYFCGHHARALSPHLYSQALTLIDPDAELETFGNHGNNSADNN